MANRPRRPRPDPKTPDPTKDNRAEATREDVAAASGEHAPSADEQTGAAPGPERTAGALPPPEDQPGTPDDDIARQARAEEGRADEPGADTAEPEPSATEIFAAEEGLAPESGKPRRHLGEFEDDETLPASEPLSVPSTVTDAYHDPQTSVPESAPPPSSPSFGPLLGAALAGAVLALVGAALLASAGLLPGTGQPEGQYASVGEVEAVSSEVADLRAGLEQLQSAQAAGGTETSYATATDLAALSDRLAAAEQSLQEQGSPPDEALQAAQAAQESADASRQTADAAQAAAADLSTRLDDVETRFAALEEASRRASVALSAAGLKAAIDRGGPFMPELETFASASGGGAPVEALREFAAEGVPTQGQLAADWPQAEADIRRAAVQPATGAAVGDQILAGLSSLVTVRSTGDDAAGGDDLGARLSRMTAAVQGGDLNAWRGDWEALPEPARQASSGFADRVEARRQASAVVDEALAGAAGSAPGTDG